ncbi:MAG: hypothetical protein ABSG53_33965 [Thermoguttaceae bacterium]
MASNHRYSLHRPPAGLIAALFLGITVAIVLVSATLNAQVVGGYVQQAVGGISIKSDGLIENASVDTLDKLRAVRARLIKNVPADLNAAVSLAKVRQGPAR